MRTIRALIYYIVLLITVIPVGVGCVLLWPFFDARKRFDWLARPWMKFAVDIARPMCGLDFVINGKENLPPKDERILVVCKHQSAWETLFLPGYMPQSIGYVYKRSLHWIPFFGWAVKSMGMVGIDRSKGRQSYVQLLKGGKEFLDRGWWMAIFPEGTRVAPGKRVPYKSGAARFAVSAHAKILPIALNSGEFWGRNSLAKNPGTITVSIGPVIDTDGKTFDEVNAEAENWIENEMKVISAPGLYD